VLTVIELSLGYAPGTLTEMTRDGETLMRILHYPPVVGTPKAVRSGAHTDIDLITLLVAGTEPGLEVQTREGEWVAVEEAPGSVVLNAGDMLEMFSNWELPSTTHRVVNPPVNTNISRYSWPFFVHPRGEVVVHPETGFTAGQYLRRRLYEIGVLECADIPPEAPGQPDR
jgi:isopenicillin N synthase-like dioxygenase